MESEKMNFTVQTVHVRLASSCHKHFHLRFVFQNIFDRFEDILVLMTNTIPS